MKQLSRHVRAMLATWAALGVMTAVAAPVEDRASAAMQAGALFEAWRALNLQGTTLVEDKGVYFAQVTLQRQGRLPQELRRQALIELNRLWASHLSADCTTLTDDMHKKAVALGHWQLDVKGNVLYAAEKGDDFVMAFAAKADAVDAKREEACRAMKNPAAFKAIAKDLLTHPERYRTWLRANGARELALLADLKSYEGSLDNVTTPVNPMPSLVKILVKQHEVRAELAEIDPMNGCVTPELVLVLLDQSDKPDLVKLLIDNEIDTFDVQPSGAVSHYGILNQVNRVNGFARFDTRLNAGEPVMMPRIKQLFAAGKDIELATYLLERAVEESPRNPVVWEHLTAAYDFAGKTEQARIARRAWFMTETRDVGTVVREILSLDSRSGAKALTAFINKYIQ
ncbi:MAG: hypothetical protein J6S08_01600 [Duodenibacillus sp.]|nr:hypothetical protein [Duodenibacillus sp.]